MKLLAENHLAVLFDNLTWRDNPFVPRDARRDRKRKQPWKALLWMCGTLLVGGGLGVWAIYTITQSVHGFPWFLGGDMGTALCILISGIHVWFIMGTAQKHTSMMLTQEVAHNTFPYLLMLPLPTFQWLLQSAVYPWLAAMRVAVLLLPVYGLCVGLGGISWADVLMLYLVFAMIAVSVPAWRKPALSDTVASGVSQATPAAQSVTTPGGMNTTQQQQQAATGTSSSGSGGWTVFLFLPMFLGIILAASSGRRASVLYFAVKEYIPDDLLNLLPSSVLSWPLIIARSLVTGFDWFGIPLWPLPFVVVAFLISRYTQVVRSCEFLGVGTYRELPNVETYQPRRRLEYALKVGQAFVVTGYLWKWIVQNGGIGRILPPIPGSGVPGLNAFVYLLLLMTIARLLYRAGNLGRWLIPPRRVTKESTLVRIAPRSALLYLGEPLLFAALFYFVCCLFARTNPFTLPVLELAGKMLLIGLSGAALGFVANRALGVLAWVGATFYFLVAMGPTWAQPLMYFSPTLGLLRLGGSALGRVGGTSNLPLDWWRWPLWMGALTLAILPLSLFLMARAASKGKGNREQGKEAGTQVFGYSGVQDEQTDAIENQKSKIENPPPCTLDPTQVGLEAFSDAAFAQKTPDAQSDSPVTQRLIAAVQGVFDNAIMVKEMRAGLRNKLLPNTLRTTFLTYFVITAVLTLGIPSVTEIFGGGLAETLYGRTSAPVVQALASTLGCWILAFGLAAFWSGTNGLTAFPGERDKSTLGFLLMTPLTGLQIVFGKLAGILFAQGTGVLTMGVWMLLLSAALCVGMGSLVPLLVWGGVVCAALLTAFTIGLMSLAFSALFPRVAHASIRGWIWFVVFQIFIQARSLFVWLWQMITDLGVKEAPFWPVMILIVLLFNGLMFCLALWGVSRMRKGDIAFATSKREN